MRAGSNPQAGKAVVDSNLDPVGLGYFYFPQEPRGGEVEGAECACGGRGGLKSFYKCQTMTSDQGLRRNTLINSPGKAQGAIQKRDSSFSVSSAGGSRDVRATRRAKEEDDGSEGRKEGVIEVGSGGVGGDYTIIQITAGYNLVADVSRSTMPTTHRRACVRTYTLKEFQCPASNHRAEKKTAVDISANLTTQLFIALSGNMFFVSNADETIHENNDREPVFLQNGEKVLKHTSGKVATCLLFFSSDSCPKNKT